MSESVSSENLADLARDPTPLDVPPPEMVDRVLRAVGQHRPEPDAPGEDPLPEKFGRVRVTRRLGAGGMGVVYEGEDPDLGRPVAIKVMAPALASYPGAREQFMREARAAAAINNDHVVPVFDIGAEERSLYLVMPLLRGEPLAQRLRRGPLPPEEVLRLGREVAAGLSAAHDAGIVHRDLKPANIWLDGDNNGRALILDFGLARFADGPPGISRPGGLIGTPPYMAPEHIDGRPVDHRCDVFALGATLYECATGRPAFAGPTVTAVLRAVTGTDPRPPHETNPAVPPALSALIMRMLAKEPGDRPATARAVAEELAALAGGAPARPVPSVAARHRRPAVIALALGAVLAAAGAAVYVATRSGEPATAPDDTGGPNGQPAPAVEPLRAELTVLHFQKVGEGLGVTRGPLGRNVIWPKIGDQVTAEARLNRPAFAHLFAFAPDGRVHLLSSGRADVLRYPAAVRGPDDDVRYGLTDGTGLYVFAVLAADEPLPPGAELAAQVKWVRHPATAGEVYVYDGDTIATWVPDGGNLREYRAPGEQAIGASGGVVRAGAELRKLVPNGRVTAVGFGVGER